MKSNILLPLGSLIYFASLTLCGLQIRHEQQTTTIEGTTCYYVGDTTYYYVGGTTYYHAGGTTYYLASGSEGIITFTITGSQASAATTTDSQIPTTTVTDSQAPATTITIPLAPATTVANSQPTAITATNSQPPATTAINSQPPATTVSTPQAPATTFINTQPAATTAASSQAPVTTLASSQPAATILTNSGDPSPTIAAPSASSRPSSQATLVSASGQPVATTLSTHPSAAATSRTASVSPATVSGKPASIAYSSGAPSLPATPVSAPSATPTGKRPRDLKKLILDALQKLPDVDRFAATLNQTRPDVFELLDTESNYTVFAPNNAAMEGEGGGGLRRREGELTAQLALSFVKRGAMDPPLTSGPRTLNTSLTDQRYVNLGPGETAKIVSIPLDKDLNIAPGVGTYLSIVSGMGRNITVKDQEFIFEAGAINVVNGPLTLPVDLPTALRLTNGTEFEEFLSSSGQLDTLSTSPRVTIFALTDATMASAGGQLTSVVLDEYIIRDFLGYTPSLDPTEMYDTAAGSAINITKVGSGYFVNGLKIVKPDVIIKNGVVHYVENILPPPPCPCDVQGIAGRSSVSPFITILAAVAAFTRYHLMA